MRITEASLSRLTTGTWPVLGYTVILCMLLGSFVTYPGCSAREVLLPESARPRPVPDRFRPMLPLVLGRQQNANPHAVLLLNADRRVRFASVRSVVEAISRAGFSSVYLGVSGNPAAAWSRRPSHLALG